MKVFLKGYLSLRNRSGLQGVVELEENSTLCDLLPHLPVDIRALIEAREDGEPAQRKGEIAILVNGRHYTHLPERLATRLEDGDEVAIFPSVCGG